MCAWAARPPEMAPGSPPRVGFIGLGHIGSAIAARLCSVLGSIDVFDAQPAAMENFRVPGARLHASARQVADVCGLVFTCLPSLEACTDVAVGDHGLLHGTAIRCHVEMSTVGPQCIRDTARLLAERGIDTVDCPVSGGPARATAGTLSLMVSGDARARARADAVLQGVSSQVFTVGDRVGMAQGMKLVNNLLAAANFASTFEALVLGTKMGLDPDIMAKVISASSGRSTGIDSRKTEAIFSGRFDSGGKARLLDKDVFLAFEAAAECGFPVGDLTVLQAVRAYWSGISAAGMAEWDVSAAICLLEQRAGVEVRSAC